MSVPPSSSCAGASRGLGFGTGGTQGRSPRSIRSVTTLAPSGPRNTAWAPSRQTLKRSTTSGARPVRQRPRTGSAETSTATLSHQGSIRIGAAAAPRRVFTLRSRAIAGAPGRGRSRQWSAAQRSPASTLSSSAGSGAKPASPQSRSQLSRAKPLLPEPRSRKTPSGLR